MPCGDGCTDSLDGDKVPQDLIRQKPLKSPSVVKSFGWTMGSRGTKAFIALVLG